MPGPLRITGYSDQISVVPGATIKFMVSCENIKSYRADIVRVIHGDANPAGPGIKEETMPSPVNQDYKARKQAILCGSYIIVQPHSVLDALSSFTIQCMVWPTLPGNTEQCIISHWNERSKRGFQLLLDREGALALRLGDGNGQVQTVTSAAPLLKREWYFIAASFDAETKTIMLYQTLRRRYAGLNGDIAKEFSLNIPRLANANGPLLMAAYHQGSRRGRTLTAGHYNGKIDSPRIAKRALSRAEMEQLQRTTRSDEEFSESVIGAWDFAKDIATTRISDLSAYNLHGETVNLPARGMTGFNWTGKDHDWTVKPEQYGAIHFHDDDLYDCHWEADFSLTIPDNWKSGCYAARLRSGRYEEYIPFYIRARPGKATAKILFLAPTASYMAYANLNFIMRSPKAELMMGRLISLSDWEQHLDQTPQLGASLYDNHNDESGICYSSRLRPILNMRPKIVTSTAGTGSGVWQYNADTHLTDWLEHEGFEYDVITDEDLHQEGIRALKPYPLVITGSHPEYYSDCMWDGLYAYTQQGGRLMYMGGNGFYWRIAYHENLPGVIEVRRTSGSTRAWAADPGEFHHSFDGKIGGLWRHIDRSPQRLAGTGFIAQGFDVCTYFRQTPERDDPRVRWAFEGIKKDELLGDFGLIGGGAAGLEVDCVDPKLGTPPHTLVVAKSEDLSDLYLLVAEEILMLTPDNHGTTNPGIRGDIAFFETPNDGAVFSFSSIAYCGSLSHDDYKNNISRLTRNVVERFLSENPF